MRHGKVGVLGNAMGGDRKVFIHWDAEIDGAFRRRLERALGELQVDYADASQVDHDPDGPEPVRLAIAAANSHTAPEADILVLGGPGDFKARNALRLEAGDIDRRTRRWIAFTEKLGAKINRPALARFAAGDSIEQQRAISLAFPADPLSKDFGPDHSPEMLLEKLAAATARAEAAERAIAAAQLSDSNALRAQRIAEAQTAAERAHVASLRGDVQRLTALNESTAFAMSAVAEKFREVVRQARDHAWRARLVAANAAEVAALHPDALSWKNNIFYSGETLNRNPHGFGVIIFRDGDAELARYAGAFVDGRREGHGVATSDDGLVWTGEWRADEAHGFGLLESPDGARFEGEVAPDETGTPKQARGWTWESREACARTTTTHRAINPALPSPRVAGG